MILLCHLYHFPYAPGFDIRQAIAHHMNFVALRIDKISLLVYPYAIIFPGKEGDQCIHGRWNVA